MKTKTKVVGFLIIIAVVAIGLITWKWIFRKAPDSVGSQKAAYEISSIELVKAFELDETTANTRFLDKVILVSGTISSIIENKAAQKISVTLKETGDMSGVICEFTSENVDLKTLKVGNKVKIKGRCTGYLLDVVLIKCTFD